MYQNDLERLITHAASTVAHHRESSPIVGTPLPTVARDVAPELRGLFPVEWGI